MADLQRREVDWYRRHGLHAERIRVDGLGRWYVIGDVDWNRHYPDRREYVEARMRNAGVYQVAAPVPHLSPERP